MNEIVSGSITLHRALTMLKTLDKRIDSRIESSHFCATVGGDSCSEEELKFSSVAVSNYKSLIDLIDFRRKVKSAISLANATTSITIGGKDMMIAEALEMKSSIAYKENLLSRLKHQFQSMSEHVDRLNHRKSEEFGRLLTGLGVSDDFDMKAKSDEFWNVNKHKLLDPLALKTKITELSDEIEQFKEDVDVALVEKNAQTVLVIK